MNRPRASISQILAVVALVGADLAIYRFARGSDAYGMDLYRLTALAPACLALNVAAFVALFAGGRSRAFCVGYVLFGIAAIFSLLLGLNDPPYETIDCYEDHHVEHRSYPGGAMARLWGLYLDFAHDGLHRLGFDYDPAATVLKSTVFNAMVNLLPQLLMACTGGWAALRVVGTPEKDGTIGPSKL